MSPDLANARKTMVDTQVRTNDVTDSLVVDAMRAVPREACCGSAMHLAYADTEVPYAPGRWLLRPRDAGKLLQAVAPRPGERALAIAAPYLAALMEAIGLTVERTDDPGVVSGAFDIIISEGAVAEVPIGWLAALAPGGRLGLVHREGPVGRAKVWLNGEDGPGSRIIFDSAAPLLAGFERSPAFSF
ncbi:MAG: protein-L-isoaspartate O-methyltransferase [Alphaproteobacteria bacterium]